jgi:AcrR family transcriptional regulator
MAPRGLAIPDVDEQLFQAAERLLLREDAAALTGRAVMREAGLAVGLLHNHFGAFDSFLSAFVLDRLRRAAAAFGDLPSRAGAGTVAGNLTDAALSLLGPDTLALSRLVASRPSVLARSIHAHTATAHPRSLLETSVLNYLQRERQFGRVEDDADIEASAVALVATVHQLLLMPRTDEQAAGDILRRVIVVLVRGIAGSFNVDNVMGDG